jgi:hypothetical protein
MSDKFKRQETFKLTLERVSNFVDAELTAALLFLLDKNDEPIDLDPATWGLFMRASRLVEVLTLPEFQADFNLTNLDGAMKTAKWMTGEAAPAPELQKKILTWVKERADAI